MIITKKRNYSTLLENIKNYKKIFLIGCSECAALCGTGGDPELESLKEALEAEGKEVTGTFKAKTGCQELGTKVELKGFKDEMQKTDCIITMSCGAGTQTTVALYPDKPVYPSNDTLFLGNMTRMQMFDERCSMCGECIIDKTGGICPVTACPKGILNGPCGGCSDGKCEVSSEINCAWVRIYDRLEKIDRVEDFTEPLEPKDWSAHLRPMNLNVRQTATKEKK
jgi:hypothetical protein